MLRPGLADLDGLRLHAFAGGRVSLLVRVRRDLHQVVVMQGTEDVEEVRSRWSLGLCEVVREVLHELRVLGHGGPEPLDAQFVVVRHLDGQDGRLLEQLLLLREDFLEEVLRDVGARRQVVLEAGRKEMR